MDETFKRQIIMEHYMNPVHKERKEDDSHFIKVNANNASCIDNLDFYVDFEDDVIKDVYFDGEACAISTASASIMVKNLIGKTREEAKEYIANFEHMVHEEEYQEELLNEAVAFDEIYKQNNRKTCVLLPYIGISKAIDE